MRTQALRKTAVLLAVLALWLPVQTLASLVMPLSWLAVAEVQAAGMMDHDMGAGVSCHESMDQPAGAAQDEPPCQHCGACQMACAGYLPASTPGLSHATPVRPIASAVTDEHTSHIVEPPDQPPRHVH